MVHFGQYLFLQAGDAWLRKNRVALLTGDTWNKLVLSMYPTHMASKIRTVVTPIYYIYNIIYSEKRKSFQFSRFSLWRCPKVMTWTFRISECFPLNYCFVDELSSRVAKLVLEPSSWKMDLERPGLNYTSFRMVRPTINHCQPVLVNINQQALETCWASMMPGQDL